MKLKCRDCDKALFRDPKSGAFGTKQDGLGRNWSIWDHKYDSKVAHLGNACPATWVLRCGQLRARPETLGAVAKWWTEKYPRGPCSLEVIGEVGPYTITATSDVKISFS